MIYDIIFVIGLLISVISFYIVYRIEKKSKSVKSNILIIEEIDDVSDSELAQMLGANSMRVYKKFYKKRNLEK